MAFFDEMADSSNFSISFGNAPKYDFGVFAQGYKFAANIVAEKLLSDEKFPDYQAYPIVFLYRHALELHLKNIIYKIARILFFKKMENIDLNLYPSHDLVMISGKACQVLAVAFPSDSKIHEIIGEITKVANEFTKIDPMSYSYRYPIKNSGEHSTKRNQIVNLRSLAIQMDSLLSNLEVIDFGINIETDTSQEIYEILESI